MIILIAFAALLLQLEQLLRLFHGLVISHANITYHDFYLLFLAGAVHVPVLSLSVELLKVIAETFRRVVLNLLNKVFLAHLVILIELLFLGQVDRTVYVRIK